MKIKVILALTAEEKNKSFQIREEVFVHEQRVPASEEFDEYEATAHHFVALDEKKEPIGSARWRKTDKGVKLERFTVKKSFRGRGIGSMLVAKVLEDISEKVENGTQLYLHAQLDAIPLYMKFGFKKQGDLFDECGILHYYMWKVLG